MRRLLAAGIALAFVLCLSPAADAVRAKQGLPRVSRYAVFEHSLTWRPRGENPWEQVQVEVSLRAPSGKPYRIGGFYAGGSTWTFRFAPPETGVWRWTARVSEGGQGRTDRGSFDVVRGGSPGFVRRSASNRFRWTFQNGAPFYPIGINDCTATQFGATRPLQNWGLDGGFRKEGHAGARVVGMDEYMRAYSGAGFDLFRWGPDNCSFKLYQRIAPGGNVYSLEGGGYADQLFTTLRRYGFRIEMVLFGFDPPYTSDAGDPAKMDAVKRYARYVVDRFGAYVDFWELMNEANAGDAWLTAVAGYLHSIDPYHHPVGTNFSRPSLPVLDFGADHWYQTEDALDSDRETWSKLQESTARAAGKPTLIDEQGNIDQNWDPDSATRLRIRSWTAFFAEGTLVFWNASFARDYKNPGAAANVFIGPEERLYVRVLQAFTRGFDARARVVQVPFSGGRARAYGLSGPRQYAVYVVSTGDRGTPTTGLHATVSPLRAGTARWIEPATGRVVSSARVKAGQQSLLVPPFAVDLALKVS
jgi:hypothetical protein